jgi:hypothetical protein
MSECLNIAEIIKDVFGRFDNKFAETHETRINPRHADLKMNLIYRIR